MKEIDKYMMATTAIHMLGDISRDEPDLCRVSEEHDDYYIGMWVTGYGFFGIKFPKESTRDLTDSEVKEYNTTSVHHGCGLVQKLKVD